MRFQSPGQNQRAVFVGKTRSGKTYLAKRLIEVLPARVHVVVLDTKGQMTAANWPGFQIVKTFEKFVKLANEKRPRLIYQPDIFENNVESLEKFFEFIYRRKNTLLYVDEAMSVCDGRSIPFFYKAILTRGGERGLGCWSATQRPMEVSNTILSESEFYFVFQLKLDGDRDKVEKITGLSREAQKKLSEVKHGFLIANDSEFDERPKKLKQ